MIWKPYLIHLQSRRATVAEGRGLKIVEWSLMEPGYFPRLVEYGMYENDATEFARAGLHSLLSVHGLHCGL
jgi:hypothetical protein